MSAVQLRMCAIEGDHKRLAAFLEEIANTCSSDDYGITPLMYAVWGGHVECVKYLVSNDFGVSKLGVKRSSLDMITTKGYTALHLAALECPKDSCREITFMLRSMNVDASIKCIDGKTAFDIATERENKEFLEVYARFENEDELMDEESEIRKEVKELRDGLAEKYAFRQTCTLYVKPFRTNFPMPSWVFAKDLKYGSIPLECTIHEAQLKPLMDTAFTNIKNTSQSIRALNFAIGEANSHVKRRQKLINSSDPTFDPTETSNPGGHIMDSRVYRYKKLQNAKLPTQKLPKIASSE